MTGHQVSLLVARFLLKGHVMEFDQYSELAMKHRQGGTERERNLVVYPAMGLVGEAGEVANDVKKYMHGLFGLHRLQRVVSYEIGDVLWYCAALATDLKLDLDLIAHQNIAKLDDRYGITRDSRAARGDDGARR
jgi:NTP pyrophosphatase (non-canonical NTP hydrolase)